MSLAVTVSNVTIAGWLKKTLTNMRVSGGSTRKAAAFYDTSQWGFN